MTDRHQYHADWHDYNGGLYFVTICCEQKHHYFGEIKEKEMQLTEIGNIAQASIDSISLHFNDAEVWNNVIMPNHIHLVISVRTRHGASAPAGFPTTASQNYGCLKPKRHEPDPDHDNHHNSRLAVIIGQLKSTIKREANKRSINFGWQERYHDHIIRNQHAYDNIMNYINTNIENWCYDCFNPNPIPSPRNDMTPCNDTPARDIPNPVGTRHGASASEGNTSFNNQLNNKPFVNADAPWRVPTANDHEA